MKKTVLICCLITLLASGCSKYGYVQLKYPTPPTTYLPDKVHTIAIVNRSFAKDKRNTVIEAVISGEIAGSDKIASDEALKGIYDRIKGSTDIEVIPSKAKLYGTGTREVPELLDWKIVKQICDSAKADVLLVMETFDSNSDILASTVTNQVNAVINGTPPAIPTRQIRMNVTTYWRLYDPFTKKIVDQYQSNSFMTFNAGAGAIAIPPPDALSKTAYHAGEEYIERFLPSYYYVKRDLYKRGKGSEKQQFKTAFRKTEVANWDGAIQLWEKLAKSSNRKNAGRASLNIAVAYEVLGKTDEALKWAQKAYEDYGNKLARDYQNQLKYRIKYEY